MISGNFDSGMLSYLGDAVWELLARERLFKTVSHGNKKANRMALSFVTATAQCAALEKLIPILTDEELEVYKWGRNTKTHSHSPTVSREDYQRATGLEVLFGYLYVSDKTERCRELFNFAFSENKL